MIEDKVNSDLAAPDATVFKAQIPEQKIFFSNPVSRLFILAALITICVVTASLVKIYLGKDIIYTHLFYLPIIVSGLWYYKKALWVAAALGVFHVSLIAIFLDDLLMNSVLRSVVFLIIAYTVGVVSEAKDKYSLELINEKQEKSLILENLSEYITYKDVSLKIIWANPSASQYLKDKYGDVAGSKCYEVWYRIYEQ